jgi:predicted RNA-binding Zn ribbon-like protein
MSGGRTQGGGTATETPRFKFTGGRLCLDYVNTLRRRLTDRPLDLLRAYADLVTWGRDAGALTAAEAQALLREGARRPREAQAVVRRAVEVREALYRIFTATAGKRAPAPEDVAALNAALGEALAAARIVPRQRGFAWDWTEDPSALQRPLWPVVRSAAEMLTSNEVVAVRKCAAADCAWVFMDQSKNRSRRWCDMRVCGNRAKVRRHYRKGRTGRNRGLAASR